MRIQVTRGIAGVVLWILASMSGVYATPQAMPGRVSGLVIDETGGVLVGVRVTLVSADGITVASAVTSAAGRFEVGGLTVGVYRLSCRAVGFSEFRQTGLRIEPGSRLEVPVTLHLAVSAEVVVRGARTVRQLADLPEPQQNLVGIARAASEGAVTAQQLRARPLSRAGEVLESVPGLIVSQHSGEGKANQYYLRGFNLDHGTDFSTSVAGVPVNLSSHAHGHGYSDLTFMIPELVSAVVFRKGPYYAADGDFSAAGAAQIGYTNSLDRPLLSGSVGQHGWTRLLAAASPSAAGGSWLLALDVTQSDGPWVRADDYRKVAGVVRYTRGRVQNGFSVTGMAYDGRWNATDQIPRRAVQAGLVSRFGTLDDTNGGRSSRYSVSAELLRTEPGRQSRVSAYAMRYQLGLFSNFTYALDDDVRGDQFEQSERRWVAGMNASHIRLDRLSGYEAESEVGLSVRYDVVPRIGLYRTEARVRHTTVREDALQQGNLGLYAQTEVRWASWLRTTQRLRVDGYGFDVDAGDPANAGTTSAWIASPKVSVAMGPWRATEVYLNAGGGFHSNDARGTTITKDPATGMAVDPVTPLVRAYGTEVGLRSVAIPRVQLTASLWHLRIASELVFVGDAGTTDTGRASRRSGVEAGAYVRLSSLVSADADLSWSSATFADKDSAGTVVPGAARTVASAGVAFDTWHRISGSLRVRHFGPRYLVEDASVRSAATTLINAEVAVALAGHSRLVLDGFNLLNGAASDIDYFYTSRLPGEASGVDDIHSHPALPRTFRVTLRIGF